MDGIPYFVFLCAIFAFEYFFEEVTCVARAVVCITPPFGKIKPLSDLVIFSDVKSYIPQWDTPDYLNACRKYAIEHKVYLVPSRFVVDNITRSKDSNPRLAASIGLGVFFGIAPLWGYQMIAAAVTAHFTHLNKAVAVISSNISIPPMIPFILYGSYWTGAQVLQRDMPLSLSDITLERVAADLVQYIAGSFTMAAVCGAAATAVGYALLVLCKRTPGHE